MTITLGLEIIALFIYCILEQYCYSRSLELKVTLYYEHCEMLRNCSELDNENVIQSETTPAVVLERNTTVSQPVLMEETIGLYDELVKELGIEDILTYEDTDAVKEDELQMEDLLSEETFISTGYESFASAKIQDGINGPQQWVVSIVGMEEHYIHISDGKRLWVNIGPKASKLRIGDVLVLDVIREEKNVQVQNLLRIESAVSDDYIIPDEEEYISSSQSSIAV